MMHILSPSQRSEMYAKPSQSGAPIGRILPGDVWMCVVKFGRRCSLGQAFPFPRSFFWITVFPSFFSFSFLSLLSVGKSTLLPRLVR